MKKLIIVLLLSFLAGGCNDHKKVNDNKYAAIVKNNPDSTYNPKVDVRVNRKYDDKGNLIQFDSTYSYFYSSPGMKTDTSISSDSLFSNFKSPLSDYYRDLFNSNMNGIFFNDSLFKYDFYNNDYFSKRFDLNLKRFENMFHQMDSAKTGMFQRYYPNGEVRKK
jgi:hypothetical protein